MKTTLKNYNEKAKAKSIAVNDNFRIGREIRQAGNSNIIDLLKAKDVNNKVIETLENEFFNLLDTVNVSFMIGSRSYYRVVAKIGKFYFDKGDKLTRSNGYHAVKEVAEITEEMTEEMISDSYYY